MQGRVLPSSAVFAETPYAYPLRARAAARQELIFLVGVIVAHIMLGLLLRAQPATATVHALLICGASVWAVFRWKPTGILCLAAYATGADVLWRMTGAQVPWEISKYLVVFLCLGGILRLGRRAHWSPLVLLYFLVLLPSIVVISHTYRGSIGDLTRAVSFNLSGPLALFASAWYASQLTLAPKDVRRILVGLIGPLLAIAVITFVSTQSAIDLSFTDESNLATSGGFGPNQVSVVLGLGALVGVFLAIDVHIDPWQRWVGLALVSIFGMQSALTFSRGGLYSFAIAVVPAALVLANHKYIRKHLARFTIIMTVITATVLFPRLDSFTGGALSQRFEDTDPSHRTEIVGEDLRIWWEHPIFGVGPGGARFERRGEFRISHTEYSRLLAEHGVFGLAALVTLLTIFMNQCFRPQPLRTRALRVAFMLWSLVSMLHVGMRIAAIGFAFGIGCVRSIRFSEEQRLLSAMESPDFRRVG